MLRRITVWVAFVAVFSAFGLTGCSKAYEATTVVRIEDLEAKAVPGVPSSALWTLDALNLELKSWPCERKIIMKLRMDVDLVRPRDWEQMYRRLNREVKFGIAPGGPGRQFITISVRDAEPTLAASLANVFGDVLVEATAGAQYWRMSNNIDFLKGRVKSCEQTFAKAEAALAKSAVDNPLQMPRARQALLDELADLQVQVAVAQEVAKGDTPAEGSTAAKDPKTNAAEKRIAAIKAIFAGPAAEPSYEALAGERDRCRQALHDCQAQLDAMLEQQRRNTERLGVRADFVARAIIPTD